MAADNLKILDPFNYNSHDYKINDKIKIIDNNKILYAIIVDIDHTTGSISVKYINEK
jgi:hypothetical protein